MTSNGFASAALFALVFDGLRRQGIGTPEPPPLPGLRHAGPPVVAHGRKRDLLSAVMARHGPVAILRVGEAVADHDFHPMLHALLRATGPVDLIRRWLRLERYAHSHHRTVADRLDAGGAELRHVSLDGQPPSAAEDLLVLGVYLGLLRAIGVREVAAEVHGETLALPDGLWDADAARRAVSAEATATWRLRWSGRNAAKRKAPPCRRESPLGAPAVTFGTCSEANALAAVVAEDPARHLSLEEMAAVLGLGPRTLQRRLAAHGLTITAVGRAEQVRHACALLAGGDDPLGVVGFVCGFTDQAHFTREFRKRVNMTPGAYRALVRDREAGTASSPSRSRQSR